DLQIEQKRPVLNIVEVVFDTLPDLFLRIQFAAPTVDLGPAGHAGLHPVAGKIAVHYLVKQAVVRFGGYRMRPRADKGEAAEKRVEELWQFVDRRLADDAADACYPRIALRHRLARGGIAVFNIHRAELVDLDHLVVEAVPLLLEDHRPLAVELYGDGRRQHDG